MGSKWEATYFEKGSIRKTALSHPWDSKCDTGFDPPCRVSCAETVEKCKTSESRDEDKLVGSIKKCPSSARVRGLNDKKRAFKINLKLAVMWKKAFVAET